MSSPSPPSPSVLLILPPAPATFNKNSLRAAYAVPLQDSLTGISEGLSPTSTASLDILLPCSHLSGSQIKLRSDIFASTQHLLAGVYALIGVIAGKAGVELDGPGGVDVKVLLVEWDENDSDGRGEGGRTGPVVDIATVAKGRKYGAYYILDTEEGDKVWRRYSGFMGSLVGVQMKKLWSSSSYPSPSPSKTTATSSAEKKEGKKHTVVAVGGTFDHLHTGHKLLLTATALMLQPRSSTTDTSPRRLIVGITGDELLVNKKHAELLETWEQREQNVINFLLPILTFSPTNPTIERLTLNEDRVNGKGILTRIKDAGITIECIKISDPFGPTITDEAVTCLVVSGETRGGGQAVNEERAKKGWEGLEMWEIDVLDAEEKEVEEAGEGGSKVENFAAKISSSAIREKRAKMAKEGKGGRKSGSPSL